AVSTVSTADTFLAKLAFLAEAHTYYTANLLEIPDAGYDKSSAERTLTLLRSLFPAAISIEDIAAVAPTFTPGTIDPLDDVVVPEFTATAPVLEMPAIPSSALPSKPNEPEITDPVIPPSPTLPSVTPLILTGITFHEVEGITIPELSASRSVDDLVVPTNNFTFYEQLYSSALLDELQAKLLDNLQNGGYGIEPWDESALFDRARSRELESAMQQTEALIAGAAARGFPYPPGDLTVVLQRAEQDLQNKVSTINRDIALKRADLYVQNRQFTIEQTKALEQILIGYHNSMMERTLNAAKATLEAALKIYDAQVARFNAQLESDKTAASILESRIRAVALQLERARVQMEGTRVENDIQRTYIEVFKAQWHGVEQIINLWKGQLEGAQIAAGIQKLRLEAFHELISAFTAEVQAKVAEFNMYESGVKGQTARTEAFAAEARAYTATVEAAKVRADILIARLKGQIEVANQGLEEYKTEADVYKTNIDAQAQTIDAKTRVYGAQVQGASAEAGAIGEAIRLDLSEKELEMRRNIANANIKLTQAKNELDVLLESLKLRVEAGQAAGQYYTAIVSAAVNSINTLSAIVAQQQ
ncbi:MAG: hypothetical protein Q8P46_00505, partial [Hyphomicrobiales bacterium]|nr:hypothetical protein [Hyphomicrobiales bacterium]